MFVFNTHIHLKSYTVNAELATIITADSPKQQNTIKQFKFSRYNFRQRGNKNLVMQTSVHLFLEIETRAKL